MMYEKQGLYIDEAHLEAFAESFARTLHPTGSASGRSEAALVRRALRFLDAQHDALALKWSNMAAMPGAVRWLLDNHWLLQREGRAAARTLAEAASLRFDSGSSILLRLCRCLLRCSRNELSQERMLLFLRGFEKALILEREELYRLIPGLKCAVVLTLEELYRAMAETADSDPEPEAAALFASLRMLGSQDYTDLLEQADPTEQALRRDPAGLYPAMAEASRAAYRSRLSRLARQQGIAEYTAARKILALAEAAPAGDAVRRHVGYWLYTAPLGSPAPVRRGSGYLAVQLLLTLIVSLWLGFAVGTPALAALLLIPVSEPVRQAIDFLLLRCTPPTHLPRLALEGGIPDAGRTLCVISALLTDADGIRELAQSLEDARLLNRDAGRNLAFALLADLPESDRETVPEDAALLQNAAEAVTALNARYGSGFYLLTRPRRKNADGRWCGWERKRGALLETMRLLRGQPGGISVTVGDPAALSGTRYLLVLDSDSRMAPGIARTLAGIALHPLCRPVIDRTRGIVTAGHAILAPRIGVQLAAAGQSDFSRIFAGQGGTDPYGGACSELFMDRFGRSGFAGKGLIDIDAYLCCMGDRVPENTMLSHDAVEGAFLRCGFIGDAEVCDGFPGSVLADYRRTERWVRGDWQNLPFLFGRGRSLPQLERWRLLDSLRRSLVPVMTLVCLFAGLCSAAAGLRLVAVAALTALLSQLLLAVAERLLQRDSERGVRYRSVLFVGIGGGMVRCMVRLLLLPAEAWFHLCGIVRALWRMGISHRRALQWQTAGQSETRSRSLWACCRALWPALVPGLALVLCSPGVFGVTAGLLWLLLPLNAWLLSLPARAPAALSPEDRDYLLGCARETWSYFDRYLTPEDHFLPPDNVQSRPPLGAAHRTSPTNIGLALLSILSAMELEFITTAQGLERIGCVLDTVERLPKRNGHLFNWYNTLTLAPMEPRYVSTVDSGNLCACLIALEGGLRAHGAPELAGRAHALAEAMDFAPLYDPEHRLLRIGLEPGKAPADAWYDLLSSEARLTAYLAVARGDAPRALWQRLSRGLLQCGGYRGMASWTGTMFEYLMPELLLPTERGSLLWESAQFCLYVQRRRVRGTGLPWGCSESGYAALDAGMGYRYKAHGCGRLALRRNMDDELVLSPYSSFLALSIRPKQAVANLRALEALGMRDPLGFREALDCTPGRTRRGKPRRVYSVMAHHAGMSLAAAANVLKPDCLRRFFLADPAMRAYTGLLQERVPVGAEVLRTPGREQRRPPRSAEPPLWSRSGTGTDYCRPACCLLASDTYTLLVTESGITRPRWGQLAPYGSPRSPLDAEKGIELFFETPGQSISLLPDAAAPKPAAYDYCFTADAAAVSGSAGALEFSTRISLADGEIGERRELRLCNCGDTPITGTLVLRFRPLLAREADHESHPAFWGLGISARLRDGALLLRRLPRGNTGELWMCLACDLPCGFDLAPGGDSGRAHRSVPASAQELFLTDPLVTAACRLPLEPEQARAVRFALAMAYTEDDALHSARRILRSDDRAELPRTAAAVLGLRPGDVDAAFSLLPRLCFPCPPAAPVRQEALWPFGISGDLPILCARYDAPEQLERARKLMDLHLFLSGCGCDFDLVFLSRDGASYHRPLHTALSDALWRAGGELLRDARGGVHLLEDTPEAGAVTDAAVQTLSLAAPLPVPERRTGWRSAAPSRMQRSPLQQPTRIRWLPGGGFSFDVHRSLPPRAWQCMLTNGRFGYLAADCGIGHMWQGNAREMQLTPWRCRPNETVGPEALLLEPEDGAAESLFAGPEGRCRVSYFPGAAVWERTLSCGRVRTTAFVPMDTDARVLLIELDEAVPRRAVLHWQMELLLGGKPGDAQFCRTAAAFGGLAAENLRSGSTRFFACAGEPPLAFTCSRASALARSYDGTAGLTGEPVFAMKLAAKQTMVLVCGCEAPEALLALTEPAAARAALARTMEYWRATLSRLELVTPSKALDRIMNGWAAYQALACRVMGRCSLYQSGGAFGFRDQLQDTVNLIGMNSAPARAQIMRCCTRQYREGDVQHWWHETDSGARGVRTRCSDDLLWLPWAVCEYVEKTGDSALCGELLPYLESPPLRSDEADRYEAAPSGSAAESVLRHAARALELVMERGCGKHGLLRMGSGDWNDGFSAVGGESQWLSWFFLHTAERFSALCGRLGQGHDALDRFAAALGRAAERAWDGSWYLRGYYADGRPLGSHASPECRIDSIAQSWAAFCSAADPKRVDTALTAAIEKLYAPESGCIRLFTPPFAGVEQPGYISCYGPGFRENGGQYTHGALWLVMALLRRDRREEAWTLLRSLLPADRDPEQYLCEPFVIAADVYDAPGHRGEGGWSWYTGSAGWLLRIVTEELLGLKLHDGRLYVEPHLPPDWPGCSLRFHGHTIAICGDSVRVDGAVWHGEGIALQ